MSEEKWTTIQVDSQLLNTFMGCPQEFEYRFVKHLVPLRGVSPAFHKGTLAHKGLQAYYEGMKAGLDYTFCRTQAMTAMKQLAPTLGIDSEHILDVYRTIEEYIEYRKNDVFIVAFTEQVFRVLAFEEYPLRVYFTGRIDLGIVENSLAGIVPVDHKTESESWHYSTLNNQFRIYSIAANSHRLVVNRIGFQKTVKAEKKFKREDLNFDAAIIEEYKKEILPYYAKQMLIAMHDGYFPRNLSNCNKGHWGCIFSDKYDGGICNVSPAVREQKIKMYFIEKEWNPEDDA